MEVSLVNAMSRETILRQYLDTVKRQYTHILIDCQPSLGIACASPTPRLAQVVDFPTPPFWFTTAMICAGAPCSLRAGFISGMALFLKTYETELVNRTAIKRLTNIDPQWAGPSAPSPSCRRE
mgnify:CR=1 FL=1